MGNENKSTKGKVLESLRQAKDRISGEELALSLNISRTSVWKAIQALQNSGYKIDTQKNGYALDQGDMDSLCPFEFGDAESQFVYYKKIDSTMNEARKIALKALEDNELQEKVVTADEQSEGRGRGNHEWKTINGSLAFTLVSYPKLLAHQGGRALMAAQVAMANVLESMSDRRFFVRWPNDIWTEKGKVAGILDESQVVGGACSYFNLGVGVNLSECPKIDFVDKAFIKTIPSARKETLTAFLKEFTKIQDLLTSESNELQMIWERKNFDSQKKVRLVGAGEYIFKGVDENGWAMLASIDDGAVKKFAPGSVSYEKY